LKSDLTRHRTRVSRNSSHVEVSRQNCSHVSLDGLNRHVTAVTMSPHFCTGDTAYLTDRIWVEPEGHLLDGHGPLSQRNLVNFHFLTLLDGHFKQESVQFVRLTILLLLAATTSGEVNNPSLEALGKMTQRLRVLTCFTT